MYLSCSLLITAVCYPDVSHWIKTTDLWWVIITPDQRGECATQDKSRAPPLSSLEMLSKSHSNIFCCTQTDQQADEYICCHFHTDLKEDFKPTNAMSGMVLITKPQVSENCRYKSLIASCHGRYLHTQKLSLGKLNVILTLTRYDCWMQRNHYHMDSSLHYVI